MWARLNSFLNITRMKIIKPQRHIGTVLIIIVGTVVTITDRRGTIHIKIIRLKQVTLRKILTEKWSQAKKRSQIHLLPVMILRPWKRQLPKQSRVSTDQSRNPIVDQRDDINVCGAMVLKCTWSPFVNKEWCRCHPRRIQCLPNDWFSLWSALWTRAKLAVTVISWHKL